MATILNADTVVGGAVVTGDASGVLALQSGGVTGLTVSSGGAVAFSGTVSGIPGGGGAAASGSVVLTSASGGAQSITTTGYGQSVTLPNATTVSEGASLYIIKNEGLFDLKIVNAAGTTKGFIRPLQTTTVGLSDNSTSAGTWVFSNAEILGVTAFNEYATSEQLDIAPRAIDSSRDLLILSSSTNIYGLIYNKTTNVWGTVTLIRTGTSLANPAVIKTATDQFLVVSCPNTATALQAVVLTLSGTSITVGTAATATLAGNFLSFNVFVSGGITQVGSTFVFSYTRDTTIGAIRGITISGTTATIGTEVTVTGTTSPARTYTVSSSVLLAISITSSSTITCAPYTVSGTTLTLGTAVTLSTTSSILYTMPLGTRWAVVYLNTNSTASIINVTGTTATASTATLNAFAGISDVALVGSKIVVASINTSTLYFRYFSDNSGTINVSNAITQVGSNNWSGIGLFPIDSNTAGVSYYISTSRSFVSTMDISTATPVLSLKMIASGTATNSIYVNSGSFFGSTGDAVALNFNNTWLNTSISNIGAGISGFSLFTKNGIVIVPTILINAGTSAYAANNYAYFRGAANNFAACFQILELAQ